MRLKTTKGMVLAYTYTTCKAAQLHALLSVFYLAWNVAFGCFKVTVHETCIQFAAAKKETSAIPKVWN